MGCSTKSWRDASRKSVGLATPASEQKEDIFQIYYARAFSWRGYFGIHPWVAWKKSEDPEYTVAQVMAWNLYRGEASAISVKPDLPDREWYDNAPVLMYEVKGEKARRIIEKVQKKIQEYPFHEQYRIWPGPNSNTFVAYLIRNIEELKVELPSSAIGKDYLGPTHFLAASPSGTGFQLSLWGALGLTLGLGEGVEINLLGLNFGVDIWTPALKLPFVGRLGFADRPIQ